MTEDQVECPYCGEVFEGDEQQDARTKEGVHRAQEHVNTENKERDTGNGKNIVDRWKSEGKRA